MKPKICLVCDVPNWAFDIIARKLKESLSDKYDIKIDYFDIYKTSDEFYDFLEKNKEYDLIHFFWRKSLLLFESEVFKSKVIATGNDVENYIKQIRRKISTGVYDFLFLDKEGIERYKNVFNSYVQNYYVSSKRLFKEYEKIDEYNKPVSVVHDICDGTKFSPNKLERFDDLERDLVIGWVGNGARNLNGIDLKGFHTIIEPAIKELKAEGYKIKEHYADRNVVWRTPEEMPTYYNEIDLCLCTSIHEGTPLPILEAMYSGVPVITTDVGIVREALGKKQQKFIIGDRCNGLNDNLIREVLKEKIVELVEDRSILRELSKENLESIKTYDGGKIIKEFECYFDKCLKDLK